MELILLVGGGLILLLLAFGVIITVSNQRSLVEERLGPYLKEEKIRKPGEKASPVGEWLNKRVERSSWGGGIARELARADLKLKPAEYIALMVIVGIGVGVVGWFFGGRSLVFSLVGVLVGISLPRIYVRRQQGRRLILCREQLPDMLNLVVNGLRAGFSIMQAMEKPARNPFTTR